MQNHYTYWRLNGPHVAHRAQHNVLIDALTIRLDKQRVGSVAFNVSHVTCHAPGFSITITKSRTIGPPQRDLSLSFKSHKRNGTIGGHLEAVPGMPTCVLASPS